MTPETIRFRSFSDPDGFVEVGGDCVYRYALPSAVAELSAFLGQPAGAQLLARGSILGYRIDEGTTADRVKLTHPKIWFPTFPYEWIPEQLYAAADLTLQIEAAANEAGYELKDASPFNVLFEGARPVFVDLLSLRRSLHGSWHAYGQFVREFIVPLVGSRFLELPLSSFFLHEKYSDWGSRLNRALPLATRLRPAVFLSLVLPEVLGKRRRGVRRASVGATEASREKEDLARALTLKIARYQHRSVAPKARATAWSAYRRNAIDHYSATDLEIKRRFVSDKLRRAASSNATVLDVGSNDGAYSLLAAQSGYRALAVDSDGECLLHLRKKSVEGNLPITTVMMDVGRPTPAVGWDNSEFPSFLQRAREQFDVVLLLAVVHHLLVSSRIPLPEILRFARHCSRKALIVEYVDPSDARFIEVAGPNLDLYRHISRDSFESALSKDFVVRESLELNSCGRVLYHAEVRP